MGCWKREQTGPVALLKLRRPPINALDQDALEELTCQLSEIDADSSRVLVVTGGLDDIFCTGGDLKFWRAISDAQAVSQAGRDVFDRLARLGIPTIAAINGHVIGDGLALALACDIRMSSDRATFRLPEVAYGFIPGWGTVSGLAALIGRARSADLLLTGRQLDAKGALAVGLVSDVVPAADLIGSALERGRALADASGSALAATKCALRGGDERECFSSVWGSPDWQEGISALLEKRAPRFERRGSEALDPAGRLQTNGAADRGNRCC